MRKALKWIEPLALLAVPVFLIFCALYGWENTALTSFVVVLVALLPFFLRFELERARPRDIMPIVVLAAIAAVGRVLFAPFPNFKPVSAIVIVGALVFGRQSGFLIGALAALASNMFFGQGAWTPWQMYCWGMVGYWAGALNQTGLFRKPLLVYAYGFLSAWFFGAVMDTWYLIAFMQPITWASAIATYGAGIPFTVSHAVSTVFFLLLTYGPWYKKLERVKRKFGMLERERIE